MVENLKLILMKTFSKPIGEIRNEYIDDISLKWDDISTLEITIPSKENINGKMEKVPIYEDIYGLQQQLILQKKGDNFWEESTIDTRFIITDFEENKEYVKDENGDIGYYKVKKIKCKSYESTLGKLILDEDIQRVIKSKSTALGYGIGILDMFAEQHKDWTVQNYTWGIVEKKAPLKRNEIKFKGYRYSSEQWIKIDDKQIGDKLLSGDIPDNIVPYEDNEIKLYFKFYNSYSPPNHYVGLNNHNIVLPRGIKNFDIYYDKNMNGDNCLRYHMYLDDNTIIDQYKELVLLDNVVDLYFNGEYTNGERGVLNIYNWEYQPMFFEKGEYNWVDFLRKNVSKAFNGVYFNFDTVNKKLIAYDKSSYNIEINENYGSDIYSRKYETILSPRDYLSQINYKHNADNIITKLYVTSENTSIADVNDFGNVEYIYNFDYFINNGQASEDFVTSWERYLAHIEGFSDTITELRIDKNTYNKQKILRELEKTQLDYEIRDLSIRRVSYQSNNKNNQFDTEIKDLSVIINSKLDKFNSLMTEISVLDSQIENISKEIFSKTDSISFENAEDENGKIFNNDVLQEIQDLTIEKTVQDNTFLTSNGLYKHYKDYLKKINERYLDFTIDGQSIFAKIDNSFNTSYFDKFIGLGGFVHLEGDKELEVDECGLRVTELQIIPKSNIISNIRLTNRDEQLEDFSGASSLSSDVGRANGYVNNYRQEWSKAVTVNDYYNKIMNEGMDLKASIIRSRNNRVKLDFTEAGMYIIDSFNEDRQIYIGASIIACTTDRWLNCQTSIDAEGLVAQSVYGKLFLGQKLTITTEVGDFYIGYETEDNNSPFGIQLKEEGQTKIFLGTKNVNGIRKPYLELLDNDGKLVLSSDGVLFPTQITYADNCDGNHPVEIPYRLDSKATKIDRAILNINPMKFRAYSSSASVGGTTTTYSGGTTTSNSGGSTTTYSGGSYSNIVSQTSSQNNAYIDNGIGKFTSPPTISEADPDDWKLHFHSYYIPSNQFIHSHDIQVPINIPSHAHSIDSHNHTIEPHTHNIEPHAHGIVYGIYEGSMAINITVYINGEVVASNINSEQNIDITEYLKTGMTNSIKIYSSNLGRVEGYIWTNVWNRW